MKLFRILKAFGIRGFFKSLYYNFKILPIKKAIRLPLLVSKKTTLYRCKRGCIDFESASPKLGSLRFGLNDLEYSYESPSFVTIQGKTIVKGEGCHVFGPGVSLNIWKNGILIFGNNFSVAPHLRMFLSKCIEIGEDNMWSFYNLVMDTDAHPIYNDSGEIINSPQKVIFGNKCWIGAYCKILKGAYIPSGSIIGAGGTVTKKLSKPRSIYLGQNPIRENINWKSNVF